MSSFRRRDLILGAAALLPACGFAPLYGPGSPATRIAGQIAVDQIEGRMGFEMRNRLTERLGPARDAGYRLNVTLDVDSQGLAISEQNDITRYNLTGNARYALRRAGADLPVRAGNVRAFAAYSATNSPYAARVAETDARARLAVSLADQIVTRIAASAASWLS